MNQINVDEHPLVNPGIFDDQNGSQLLQMILKTYTGYENFCMHRMTLAFAGFIAINFSDAVLCPFCGLLLKDFTKPVDASTIHQRFSQGTCELLKFATKEKLKRSASHKNRNELHG